MCLRSIDINRIMDSSRYESFCKFVSLICLARRARVRNEFMTLCIIVYYFPVQSYLTHIWRFRIKMQIQQELQLEVFPASRFQLGLHCISPFTFRTKKLFAILIHGYQSKDIRKSAHTFLKIQPNCIIMRLLTMESKRKK